MFIVTVRQPISESKSKEIIRREFKSEITAYDAFCNEVNTYTIKAYNQLQPVSITMLESQGNQVFATFQIR
jgi:hypothetical protein